MPKLRSIREIEIREGCVYFYDFTRWLWDTQTLGIELYNAYELQTHLIRSSLKEVVHVQLIAIASTCEAMMERCLVFYF